MTTTVKVHMPPVTVYCPKCDCENEIEGDQFELNGSNFIGGTYCDDCSEHIVASII